MSWGYLIATICFSTSQPYLQHEYTTWMFMHLILFIWYLKGLPNFNIVFINISFQLSCNFTPFLGIYQEILLSCMILTYLCKIHNGVVFFVGSPDVMRPDKDKDKHCQIIFHNVKFILWYIQLSLWYVYLKLCINICHNFFSLTTCQENVFQITMKMHGSNLIHFTFMAPAVKFLHFMKTYSNYWKSVWKMSWSLLEILG